MKTPLLGLVGLALLLPPPTAEACGSFDSIPIFVHTHHPDRPFETFAAGRLGVLRETYRTRYLAYAYRSMMGVPTTADEQRYLVETWARAEGDHPPVGAEKELQAWLTARKEVTPTLPEARPQVVVEQDYSQYNRIQGDAFLKAAETARSLAREWKAHPALVEEWVRGQDTVFGPCAILQEPDPKLDEGLKPRDQARRRAERTYQEAASRFYCGDYAGAISEFQRIADSDDSPHQALGAYLVARTQVRQALLERKGGFLFEPATDETFLKRLAEADRVLVKVLATPKLRQVHGAARRLQSLVRVRLQRDTWGCELLGRVLQPGTGAALGAELGDLDLVENDMKGCTGLPPASVELSDWLRVTRGISQPGQSEEDARRQSYDTAVARWKKTSHVPWLVTALLKARPDSPGLPALLEASARVPVSSPAGVTLAYRASHLLHEQGETQAAQARLALVTPELTREQVSTDNLLRAERLTQAGSWEQVFQNAPRRVAGLANPDSFSDALDAPPAARPLFFDRDAVTRLEPQLTAKRMLESNTSAALPPPLRRQVTWAAFARAALVGDDDTLKATATALAQTEPAAKAELLAIVGRPTPEERRFDAQLLLMGLPRVSARLEPGEDPLASADPKLDLTQDRSGQRNWWCAPAKGKPVTPFSFVSEAEQQSAAAEWKALTEAGDSVPYFARVALAWAKAHPEDPRSPIALFRVVRASKRGCRQGSPEAKEAFRYLHKHYGKTPWAKKAPYVY